MLSPVSMEVQESEFVKLLTVLREICGRRCHGMRGRGFSQEEVKGQVGLSHLLSVDGIKLVIHGDCEDVFPQTHTTCRHRGERFVMD